jgi:hypothetical protein
MSTRVKASRLSGGSESEEAKIHRPQIKIEPYVICNPQKGQTRDSEDHD